VVLSVFWGKALECSILGCDRIRDSSGPRAEAHGDNGVDYS